MRKSLGLDRPVYVQYGAWLVKTLRGDLGFSLRTRRPVTLGIGDRLPNALVPIIVAATLSVPYALLT